MESQGSGRRDRRGLIVSLIAAPLASTAIVSAAARWFAPKSTPQVQRARRRVDTSEQELSLRRAHESSQELVKAYPQPRWLPPGFQLVMTYACQDCPSLEGPFMGVENSRQLFLVAKRPGHTTHKERINAHIAIYVAPVESAPTLRRHQNGDGEWVTATLRDARGTSIDVNYRDTHPRDHDAFGAEQNILFRRDRFAFLVVAPRNSKVSRPDLERVAGSIS
jgi:hypothetical protein